MMRKINITLANIQEKRKIIAKVFSSSARYKAKDASIWLKANVVWRYLPAPKISRRQPRV